MFKIMKKVFLLILLSTSILQLKAQTQGISYQAVLISEDDQEIPGVDVKGSYLPNQEITMRFTILDENSAINYQEEQQTETDKYGMINVTIGWGNPTIDSPGDFADIDWDGTPKSLRVEIRVGNSSSEFAEFSTQDLKFVPYAFHRNITATGTMVIDGTTDLNSDLTVNNSSPTYLTGTMDVDGETHINSDFSVENESTTNLSGDLSVQGESTLEDVNLTTLNSVSDEESFVATFENTNNDSGDGIKIKLGKKAAKNNSSAILNETTVKNYLGELTDAEFNSISGLFDGVIDGSDLTYLAGLAVPSDPQEAAQEALDMAATVCELTDQIGNKLIDFINGKLHLPYKVGPWGVHIPVPIDKTLDVVPRITVMPKLPNYDLPCSALGDGYKLPEISFSDITGTDPLDYKNHFIEFTDNTDFTMGAIKAQSIENWAREYINPVFLLELYVTFRGLDKTLVKPKIKEIGGKIAKSYLTIGVSYSSGNGDYAEWLERSDSNEVIGAGDIVGVIGGKITKDLTNAEQVMAVSSHPVVLGNTPKVGKEYLGNDVAFMGQIPVKIMGPVHSGDYIVGKGGIPGYGIAICPKDMTIEDFNHSVGRSWDENISSGPKLVNTVVGVNNGAYLNILKKYDERLKNSEDRLKNLEDKVDLLLENSSVNTK